MICPACSTDNIAGVDLCESCGMDLAGLDVTAWGVDPEDPLLAEPLSNLELKRAICLRPDGTVADAITQMREAREGCVFITDGEGALCGVFTERDVAVRVIARGLAPESTELSAVMTPGPVALRREDPFAWALHRMGIDGYRHLPIVERDQLVGFLSIRSVLEHLTGA